MEINRRSRGPSATELRQLQHFAAVAEERRFTRASRRLHLAQSALSSSVKALEEELQSRLFVRSTRSAQLTPLGRAFLEKAREALKAVQAGRQAVREIEGLAAGSIAIGAAHSLPNFIDLPSLIARFHEDYPDIEVSLQQGETLGLVDRLRQGSLDLAFLPLLDPFEHAIRTRFVACEDLAAVAPRGHPLAGRASVALADLSAYPFVDFSVGWGARALVDRAFAQAGARRRTASEVTDLETLESLVIKGLGVAILPESIAAARAPEIVSIPIEPLDVCWELVVAFAGGNGADAAPINSAARAFLKLLL
jgi:DNA-binding transcriptional LysR family regulator